ncbi:cupin domain-containing protein [Allomeiothermus silvanus]|uniref:cupin domain-containing protein n=1 Tax=Allomeiothermus silvanus TaxID=52022 RepID=UPI0023F0CA92|nr:cupin domain-containing protein [Allomeiothermus silvanus]
MFVLEAGQTVFVPRGAVHAFQNTGSAPARLLTLTSPGYLHEGFFAEVGVAVDAPKTALELGKITQTAAKYQIEILPLA